MRAGKRWDGAAVILAAGQGTRMKSNLLKVLHPVAGRPMLEHVVQAARQTGVDRCLVVVGYQAEKVQELLGDSVEYVRQEQQLGTGHAVLQAQVPLAAFRGDLLVLYGDNPLLEPATLQELLVRHRETGAAATVLSAVMPDPSGLGRIVRDRRGRYLKTVEEKDASPEERRIKEAMSGIFCFQAPLIFELLSRLRPDNAQQEYYLTDVLRLLVEEDRVVEVVVAEDYRSVIGPNTRQGLAQAETIMRQRMLDRLMSSGVTVIDPLTTYVQAGVVVGRDTVIHPLSFLEGATVIGENCEIGPMATIRSSRVEDGATVEASVVEQSVVGGGARIGPFSHLRPGSVIGSGAEIGNYAETKNANVGAGAKAHHHCYLGDVTLGERVNIGAGVVVVNYDGVSKHHSTIEEQAFVGCNANLISPVRIGQEAYVAAGSTVNRDVPPGALAIARERQENKEGYAKALKERLAGKKAGKNRNGAK